MKRTKVNDKRMSNLIKKSFYLVLLVGLLLVIMCVFIVGIYFVVCC